MSLFKGRMDSGGKFTAQDDVRGLELIAPGTVPSYLVLETADGVKWYMFINDDDEWIMHTSAPTAGTAGVGTIITGAGYGGANKTLSNLGTVAIATDFLPNGTIDLGATGTYFAEGYITKWLGHANSTITATDGVFTVVGSFVFGASGGAAGNADLVWHAHTDTNFVTFDEDQECVTFEDETFLKFGTGRDMAFDWDGTDFNVDAAASNKIFMFGEARDLDVVLKSQSSDTNDIAWDASGKTLQVAGAAVLAFGGSAALTHDDGFTITFDESDTLNIDTLTGNAGDVVRFGETYTCDVYFDGLAGYDMRWKADVDELQLLDNAQLRLGTSATLHLDMWADGTDMHIEGGTANAKVQWGLTNATDLYIHGATANRDVYWDASENEFTFADNAKLVFGGSATAGADDLVMTSNGTIINATLGATTAGIVLANKANATVAALRLDGSTNTWLGADDVGLLHIDSDAAFTDAGASLLQVVHATTAPINDAQGFLARFVDTAAVCGSPPAYCVEIDSTNNYGMNIVTNIISASNLVMSGKEGQTAAMLSLVGSTGAGWDGATGVGCVNIATLGAHAHVNAAALNITTATGAMKASARGQALRIVDTSTVGADGWVAYIDSTANDGLLINTGHAACINLKLTGVTNQTGSMMVIDGSTTAGWEGAANTGMLHLKNKSAFDDQASALYIDLAEAPTAASEGAGIHVIQSAGSATTDAYLVNIEAIATGGGLHVDGGHSLFDEKVIFAHGAQTSATAATANSTAGSGTSQIAVGVGYVAVTSSDEDDHIVLPAPVVGNVIWLYVAATGYQLSVHATDCSTITLNGAAATTGHASSTVGANTLVRCVCPVANKWIASTFGSTGTEGALEAATSCTCS